jgi:membrane-bound lytic murein transglycosylase MltF
MKKNFLIIVLSIIATFFFGQTITLKSKLKETRNELAKVEKVEIQEVKKDVLSDWDMFTLALMKVESNYNPKAVSSVGAKGYFQITPIYVAEVNRIHKTKFVYDEVVKSFEKSYEVFTLMQEAHNKDYCMDKALKLHNGDHKWYKKRVYKEMESILRYEQMRQMVKDVNSSES